MRGKTLEYLENVCKMNLGISQSEIKPLLIRALKHYAKRLREMQENEDVLKFGIDTVKNDLETNAIDSEFTEKALDKLLKESVIPDEDRKTMCLALTCYINDLNLTMETTRVKMGNFNIIFKEIEAEKEKAEELRSRICPTDWHWVLPK